MDLHTLRRFSTEGYSVIPPERFSEIAEWCRNWAIISSDARFSVLERCFRVSDAMWGDGEGAAVRADDAEALFDRWSRELPDILDAESAEVAVVLAQHLEEELRLVSAARWR